METWWSEIDGDVIECLRRNGNMGPRGIARELGISEREATAFVTMLAREGRVRITAVELVPEPAGARAPVPVAEAVAL